MIIVMLEGPDSLQGNLFFIKRVSERMDTVEYLVLKACLSAKTVE